jgi:hypothetical protein
MGVGRRWRLWGRRGRRCRGLVWVFGAVGGGLERIEGSGWWREGLRYPFFECTLSS